MAVIFPAIVLAAMVFALVDIIMRDDWQVKHLPKFGWVILVVLLPLIGTLLWFTIGREYSGASPLQGLGSLRQSRAQPSSPLPSADTSSTEQQLADLDREIEYYRRRAELERLKREADGDSTP
ncbi:PLD nuclease N-terminal domain-containing protein [Agromyces albus]|uniref:PLDc_N domain-containing protein n=1 Tax=Agromyces albus TaxID=205332 RepID=A0A4Q2L7K0_9MICO|nr:PLD nuclease N-terminal domain-containing protein [Agromyces albus]RXZ72990.1 PLDc_N domain-containing protein [Agromyces albus]